MVSVPAAARTVHLFLRKHLRVLVVGVSFSVSAWSFAAAGSTTSAVACSSGVAIFCGACCVGGWGARRRRDRALPGRRAGADVGMAAPADDRQP